MALAQLIREVVDRPLSVDEAEAAFDEIMRGEATPVQTAALLVAMRARGVAATEIAGGVKALRSAMVPVEAPEAVGVIDTCGTGGGTVTTFNISTAAALLASGLGAQVAKHGNRSFTSRCGSADVLESLGVGLDMSPARQAQVLREIGIVFLFAPSHHPAMRHVIPVRRELGMFTIMNLLGPLTNPVRVKRQVVGVSDRALLRLVAEALASLGHEHALVVHGEPGLDEMSPLGPTHIAEVCDDRIHSYTFDPAAELGWHDLSAEDLAGGDPAENAQIITDILQGRKTDAGMSAVLLNAAAALTVAGRVKNLKEGVALAEQGLKDGVGWTQLERLREASRSD